MQFLYRKFLPGLAAVAMLLALGACTLVQESSPSSFYVLSPVLPQGQQPLFEQGAAQAPVVVVGAVRVAAFLDRPQVTLRSGGNAVQFDEFVRWAEPLGDGVTRVLRANLVTLLGTPESALPWVRVGNRDFNLFASVEDVQLLAGDRLELRLFFRLSDGQSNRVVLSGERTYVSALPQSDNPNATFAALAEAFSAQLGEFSADIARDAAKLKAATAKTTAAAADTAIAEAAPAAAKPADTDK